MEAEIKYCEDCKKFSPGAKSDIPVNTDICLHPRGMLSGSALVRRSATPVRYCEIERSGSPTDPGSCGRDAKWFEAKMEG